MVPNGLISHLTVIDKQFRVILGKPRLARHASKIKTGDVLKKTYNRVIGIEAYSTNYFTSARIIIKNAHMYKISRSLPDFICKNNQFLACV